MNYALLTCFDTRFLAGVGLALTSFGRAAVGARFPDPRIWGTWLDGGRGVQGDVGLVGRGWMGTCGIRGTWLEGDVRDKGTWLEGDVRDEGTWARGGRGWMWGRGRSRTGRADRDSGSAVRARESGGRGGIGGRGGLRGRGG